jgi:hypothetical protein
LKKRTDTCDEIWSEVRRERTAPKSVELRLCPWWLTLEEWRFVDGLL